MKRLMNEKMDERTQGENVQKVLLQVDLSGTVARGLGDLQLLPGIAWLVGVQGQEGVCNVFVVMTLMLLLPR